MLYEPLHHKYRPQTFGDLVGQDAIAKTLINALLSRRIAPAYLFTGPRGTGKTSSARILAKSLNCLASEVPTPTPCGQCDVCRAIAIGSALDVIEIDAASNTGVDNIREIIERSQFAPVQCRYKVYVIDECLTGDTLVSTSEGLMRIDDPNIKGKQVLSYNESSEIWEYKRVSRWIERGIKPTLRIKTREREIRCTDNHLIRTEQGWIQAKKIEAGMKILSPVNVGAVDPLTSTEQMDVFVDLPEDINSTGTHTDKNHTISPLFWNKLKPLDHIALVDVRKNSISPYSFNKKEEELEVLRLTGKDTPTKKDMDCGNDVQKTFYQPCQFYPQTVSDLSMEHSWEMEVLTTPTHIVDFLDYGGHTVHDNKNGWNIKPNVYRNYNPNYGLPLIKDTANDRSAVKLSVTLNSEMSSISLDLTKIERAFPWNGFSKLPQKDLLGGTWMMVPSASLKQEVPVFNFTQKAFLKQKINLLLNGLQSWDIPQQQSHLLESPQAKPTITLQWESKQQEHGYQICSNILFPQWLTNLETVESVRVAETEKVYDLEVEDNHNFVANGLLVHNCHMLSTAAFNALLKTLEEPPDRVIFVLATTDPQRVLPTIISRCQRFDYRRIPLQDMVEHLGKIAYQETIDIAPEALTLIAQIANGGLRDAESLLDQLSLSSGTITSEKVWELVGAVPERDLLTLLQAIRSNHTEKVIEQCRHLMNRGREPLVVLQNLASFYLNLLIAKTAPHRPDMVAVTAPTWQNLCQEATVWDLNEILKGQQHLKDSESQLKNTTQPRLWLEVSLLGLLPLIQPSNVVPSQAVAPIAVPTPVQPPQAKSPKPEPTAVQPSPPESPKPEPTPQPTIEPIQDEPEAIPTTTPALNLQQIWQQVLRVVPMATQSLLKEHGCLLSLDNSVAEISITSEPLLKMARPRVTSIEEAFTKVCRQPIKVNLQVAPSTPSPANQSPIPEKALQTVINPPETVLPNPTNQNSPPVIPPQPKIEKPALTPVAKPSSVESIDPPQTVTLDDSNNDLKAAAQSLAKFFEGEIVVMNSQITEDGATEEDNSITVTAEVPHTHSLVSGRPDLTNIADDEDIPF